MYEGKDVSFEEFVWKCARGMAVMGFMRDSTSDKIPRSIKPSPYYKERLDAMHAELRELEKMSIDAIDEAFIRERGAYEKMIADGNFDVVKRRMRYESMLAKVAGWPCASKYFSFRRFMIEQLTTSIEHDCTRLKLQLPAVARDWFADRLKNVRNAITSYAESMKREQECCDEVNSWLAKLRTSVPIPAEMDGGEVEA